MSPNATSASIMGRWLESCGRCCAHLTVDTLRRVRRNHAQRELLCIYSWYGRGYTRCAVVYLTCRCFLLKLFLVAVALGTYLLFFGSASDKPQLESAAGPRGTDQSAEDSTFDFIVVGSGPAGSVLVCICLLMQT